MCKKLVCLVCFALVVPTAPVAADTLSGLADVTVVDGAIVSLRHEGTEYVVAEGDLILGATTRWYVQGGVETLWVEGDPAPAATVPGTSNPKAGDVGSKADNFFFTLGGSTNISSIDGIDFQETIFPALSDTFFLFERGGNDAGTWQAILADGSLGEPVAFVKTADGGPYADTGVSVNGQNAYGVVFKTDVPVQGVRITAAGHDALSISMPTPPPDMEIGLAAQPPVIDGEIDEIWADASTQIIIPQGDPANASGSWKALYDSENLYVIVDIIDDSLMNDSANSYQDDSVEFYFDGGNTKDGPPLVGDNRQYTFGWATDEVQGTNAQLDGVELAQVDTETGWRIEIKLPWLSLQGAMPKAGDLIGIDCFYNDDDDGGDTRESQIFTFATDGSAWNDASQWGTALLAAAEPVDPGTDELAAMYTLDNDANDSSGNGHHGTVEGAAMFVTPGRDGTGASMQFGGDTDRITVDSFDVMGTGITLAAWVNPVTFMNDARMISKSEGGSTNLHYWAMVLSGTGENFLQFRLRTDVGNTTSRTSGSDPLVANEWTHVAVTWDANDPVMRQYKNGVEIDSFDKAGSVVATGPGVQIGIGNQSISALAQGPGNEIRPFDGLIDDVQVYQRGLSVGEIRFLAGFLPKPVDPGVENLVAFYPLDNDANDASGNNNHGTLSGDPQRVAGMIGEALEFDGVDDHVDCGNDPSLDITGPITIGAWIYPTGSGSSNFPRIVDKSNGTGGADPGYKLYLRGAENYIFAFSAGGVFQPYSTLAADLNAWNYVAVIADGTHRKLFLNGAWEQWDETTLPSSSSNPLYIGDSPAGARPFQGIIDEVAIYNRALSEPEVRFIAGER